MQVKFSAAPGAFAVDIEGSDDDADSSYIQVGQITAVNTSNYGRFDMVGPNLKYPLFVRLKLTALTNDVNVTGLISR